MGKRRKSRELSLHVLYGMDMNKGETKQVLSDFWKDNPCSEEIRVFAEKLVTGTCEKLASIDSLLKKSADNWDVNRLATIDRNILRFAVYELLFMDDIPPKVTINESIEIAKKYSTAESGKFINGILDRIKNEYCRKR